MGGAMTAVGADVSAVIDNPAALGVFRHSEVSLTGEFYHDKVQSGGYSDAVNAFRVPQVSWVLNFNQENIRQKGLISSSLLIQYHRTKNYARRGSYGAMSPLSLTDLMVDLTNGLSEGQLQDYYWTNTNNVGTLSKVGYELYLIDPKGDEANSWQSVLKEKEQVQTSMSVQESGYSDYYSLHWGANISNKVYFGFGLNLQSLNYERNTTYSETFQSGNFSLTNTLSTSGFGINGALGIIAHPTQMLRLGISYQTPTWMTLNTTSATNAQSIVSGDNHSWAFTPDKYTEDNYMLPMRLTAGVALQLNQKGLISIEYDWLRQPKQQIPDIHTLKLGAEFVVKNNCFIRAGYACKSAFAPQGFFSPVYYDLRADSDYKHLLNQHFISTGIGYRSRYFFAEMAYQCCIENSNVYAFSRPLYNAGGTQPDGYQHLSFGTNAYTHRLVLTLGWTIRK